MNLLEKSDIDRKQAMLTIPALIKAYLRLGGFVGDGAFVDYPFNTTDVCLILDVAKIAPRQRALYTAGHISRCGYRWVYFIRSAWQRRFFRTSPNGR